VQAKEERSIVYWNFFEFVLCFQFLFDHQVGNKAGLSWSTQTSRNVYLQILRMQMYIRM